MKIKALIEKRNTLLEERDAIVAKAEEETRAFEDAELTRMDEIKTEVARIDKSITVLEESKDFEKRKAPQEETVEEAETRAFEEYVRGQISETRSGEQNITMGNNGAVIPATIAQRIIKEVKDICPILSRATMYHVKGTLKIPVWGKANSTHDIAVSYHTEFTELTADAGKFTSVDLAGYLAGALTLMGRTVINNADVDIVGFIVSHMAEKIAEFLEKELLVGTGSSAAQGITNTTNKKTITSNSAITADDLIDMQAQVKQAFQGNACWIMHSETFTAIKKLKDGNNRYLLQDDITGEFPYRLLGKPVFLSDNMPKIGSSAKPIVYGDLSALSVNFRENIEMQLLQEKYATQHAVGVVAWFEFDAKVTEHQKVAVLEMGA